MLNCHFWSACHLHNDLFMTNCFYCSLFYNCYKQKQTIFNAPLKSRLSLQGPKIKFGSKTKKTLITNFFFEKISEIKQKFKLFSTIVTLFVCHVSIFFILFRRMINYVHLHKKNFSVFLFPVRKQIFLKDFFLLFLLLVQE